MAFEWFPFYYKDFILSKKVKRMTNEQKGAYITLLIECWSEPSCSVPARVENMRTLAEWKGSIGEFKLVRSCFTPHPDHPTRLHNARLYLEWLKAKQLSESARASVMTRWAKRPRETPQEPVRKTHDREAKGFTSVGSEVGKITNKHFPPV